MKLNLGIISSALSLAIVLSADTALAQMNGSSSGAPSESDISRSLAPKTRGLPTFGTAPAPSNPAIEPTTVAPIAPAQQQQTHVVHVDAHPSATLNTIQFQFGSTVLTPDSLETLKNLGNALNHALADQQHFLIEGHTDASGNAGYNQELSKQRAEVVIDYLVKQMGVTEERLRAVGKGSSEPVAGSSPYSGVNRRVVVVNLEG
jgi:outer membrane protein OmpA-like peptidoglycan-associated protein